jgi:hypothetical protein
MVKHEQSAYLPFGVDVEVLSRSGFTISYAVSLQPLRA